MIDVKEYNVKDLSLAPSGHDKIEWAWQYMPVLRSLEAKYIEKQPFRGVTIAACLHLEAKTACLLRTLVRLGASVYASGSNPLSTQDDVCAALVEEGVHVYSKRAMSVDEYKNYLRDVLNANPQVIIDDGADLIATIIEEYPNLINKIEGGSEETTSGIKRLKAMEKRGLLPFPMISVNDADSKYLFDNRYGTGQSVMDGFMRTTNNLVAGKNFVIAGYGWCGRGVALRARSLGAKVIVTETNPHRAFEALMDGNEVMSMEKAASQGDIFLTLTGNIHVLREEHFKVMKDGVIMGNAGHFDVEISKSDLDKMSKDVKVVRPNVTCYNMEDGRKLYLLGEGRLVNLAAGDGHPIEIMDLSFALQLESALYIHEHHKNMKTGLNSVPTDIDKSVIYTKLSSLNIDIDSMTDEQIHYMDDWKE